MLIKFPKGVHTSALGNTRQGKTYAIIKSLQATKEPVLFFNTQHEKHGDKMTTGNGSYHPRDLVRFVHAGGQLNFIPKTDPKRASWELKYLIDELFEQADRDRPKMIRLVVDEVQLFNRHKHSLENVLRVSQAGLRFGIQLVAISQRPQNVHNDILSQSNFWVMVRMSMNRGWFQEYNLPYDDITNRLKRGGQYSYVTYDNATEKVEGAYKV
jgi:hypothetical protein